MKPDEIERIVGLIEAYLVQWKATVKAVTEGNFGSQADAIAATEALKSYCSSLQRKIEEMDGE